MKIEQTGNTLLVQLDVPRIDGENSIIAILDSGKYFKSEVSKVIIDFNSVEYINSLGITEIINIHRKFSEHGPGKVDFQFINLTPKVMNILSLIEIEKIAEVHPKEE